MNKLTFSTETFRNIRNIKTFSTETAQTKGEKL